MPKDNHSVMQLYLDGSKNNFFTFFYVHDANSSKINNETLLASHDLILEIEKFQMLFMLKKKQLKTFF
jgi:glucose-6-phosphate isomerase